MKRTVIYGLGKLYHRYGNIIERVRHVVAHCDRDPEIAKKFEDGITVEELEKNIDDYDEIFVTASLMKVYSYLVDELHLPEEKISALRHADMVSGEEQPFTRYYGANGEDVVLQLLLERMGLKLPDVKYLEIGTHNPVLGNNSYFLYSVGARGVLVDPLLIVERLAKLCRPEDRFIRTAVTDIAKQDTATFYESSALGSSSLHEDFYKEFDPREGRHIVNSYTVPLIGINDLLEKIGFVPDVLLVDAEGEDEKIVRGIDLERYRPKLVIVEIDHCDEVGLAKFMQGKGYKWFTTVQYTNAVFVDERVYRVE